MAGSRRRLTLAMLAGALAAWPALRVRAQAAPSGVSVPASGPAGAALRLSAQDLAPVLEQARTLRRLQTLLVAQEGRLVVGEAFGGASLDRPTNLKSISKSLLSALVGRAIAEGAVPDVRARAVSLLGRPLPAQADPRVKDITVEDLLTMRAGLERTSGQYYGRWIASANWVDYVLTRPMVAEPGGVMLYSTGSTHLLSAILTAQTGRSTLALARTWLGEPLGIAFSPWDRDPQGIYLGGNNMALSPRALLRVGELYRQGGLADGERVLPADWITASWLARTRSPFTGDGYGYGWFVSQVAGEPLYYAWGYGGQLLYILPGLGLTVVFTSDTSAPTGSDGYARMLHQTLLGRIVAAAQGRA
ncbi:serine hydrolase [Verticiella sediminum]|uniref:Serine hydrolase n=1 Tax=Verticiella sediminum TaxID=1247510 RepID=A0A556B1U7_9BURK|nr:serine hydrolase [Verticiella sediminum]TSH99158.1 serine hydrolase [Verticiella sediminum]